MAVDSTVYLPPVSYARTFTALVDHTNKRCHTTPNPPTFFHTWRSEDKIIQASLARAREAARLERVAQAAREAEQLKNAAELAKMKHACLLMYKAEEESRRWNERWKLQEREVKVRPDQRPKPRPNVQRLCARGEGAFSDITGDKGQSSPVSQEFRVISPAIFTFVLSSCLLFHSKMVDCKEPDSYAHARVFGLSGGGQEDSTGHVPA